MMKKFREYIKTSLRANLIFITTTITVAVFSQYKWAIENEYFIDLPFRLLSASVVGVFLGVLYSYLWYFMAGEKSINIDKYAILHIPLFLLWLYPLQLFSSFFLSFSIKLFNIIVLSEALIFIAMFRKNICETFSFVDKNLKVVFSVYIVAMVVVYVVFYIITPANLVNNGNFKIWKNDRIPYGWEYAQPSKSNIPFSRQHSLFKGNWVKIDAKSTGRHGLYQKVKVDKNTNYSIKATIKLIDKGGMNIGLRVWGEDIFKDLLASSIPEDQTSAVFEDVYIKGFNTKDNSYIFVDIGSDDWQMDGEAEFRNIIMCSGEKLPSDYRDIALVMQKGLFFLFFMVIIIFNKKGMINTIEKANTFVGKNANSLYKYLIRVLINLQNIMKILDNKLDVLDRFSKKVHLYAIIIIVFMTLITTFHMRKLYKIYEITLNRPYIILHYDEPFPINCAINALNNGLDPFFYDYGGTSIYPCAAVFWIYESVTGVKLKYTIPGVNKYLAFPFTGRIEPVKPIYITKVLAFLVYICSEWTITMLFTLLLAPIPFWPNQIAVSKWFEHSGVVDEYKFQMMPEVHLVLFAGITAILFFKYLLEEKRENKYLWAIICAMSASFCASAKITSAYIILLPLALLPSLIKQNILDNKNKYFIFFICLIIPVILINPATILASSEYLEKVVINYHRAQTINSVWLDRTGQIIQFTKDIYLFSSLPYLMLIMFFIASIIIIIKIDIYAFIGFALFYMYSVISLTNANIPMFYPRYLAFLTIPTAFWIILPIPFMYHRLSKKYKTIVALILLLVTLVKFPYASVIANYKAFFNGHFADTWERESRDELIEFVKENNATVYFYDYHAFSMPNNLGNQYIPFRYIEELPKKLSEKEYIGYIEYKVSLKKEYQQMMDYLHKKYKIKKVLGNRNTSFDLLDYTSLPNPTIVLMK